MSICKSVRRTAIAPALMLALAPFILAADQPAGVAPAMGTLQVKVAIVAGDLSLKPIAKRPFRVNCAEMNCELGQALVTDFDGQLSLKMIPGKYVLSCVTPVEFEGKRFNWKVPFTLVAGETLRLELSNDNAEIAQAEPATATASSAPVPTEGLIFRKVKASVFKIVAEGGSGSGFLVDEHGLVLTNHHVVQGADYLAVKIDEKRKYRAVVAADDPAHDLAVLRISADIVHGIQPLSLSSAAADHPSVVVGERVLAVGSPLATETILTSGIVSKVEEGVIYSDVSINPGNSGGPLFSMLGEVIGVNTFGLVSQGGPGVAGIIRIHLAQPLIEKARASLASTPSPDDDRLPEASDYRFPPDKLKEIALRSTYRPNDYHIEAGKIDVQFVTPVVLAELEVKSEKEAAEGRKARTKSTSKVYAPGEDFYEWRRYAGDYRAVVRIQAIPEITMTGGSVFAVIMLGANAQQKYKFKTDFDRMELIRDGTVVEPIFPGRAPNVVNQQQGLVSMKDISYYGAYEYPPEAFRPGAKVILKVWEQGHPEPKVRDVTPELLNRVWTDFQPYFDALEMEVATHETEAKQAP